VFKGGINEGALGCYQIRIVVGERNKKNYILLPM
jgi:hypothetical protein